jgi:hypothetical protein
MATVMLNVGGTLITDNGVGDLNPAIGQISNVAAPSGFTTSINTGTTTSTPSIDLSSVNITSTSAATLVVKFTETGLTQPAGLSKWLSQFTGNWNGGSATVELKTYLDTGNTAFGTTTLLGDLTSAATPFSSSVLTSAGGAVPFSLTEVLTITAGAAGEHFSLDGSISAVPEPASLAILGASMVGLSVVRRRKSKV